MKLAALLAATAASVLAVPAVAQDNRDPSQDFDGPYISIGGGATLQGSDRGETLVFDTNRDGSYGDTVTTVSGANAFSPGFCNGAATSTANIGCRNDKDGPEFFGRLGYDKRMGNFVLGAVVEGGHSVARDSVSGFSTTPASYTMSREADYQANAACARVTRRAAARSSMSPAAALMRGSTTSSRRRTPQTALPIMARRMRGVTPSVAAPS